VSGPLFVRCTASGRQRGTAAIARSGGGTSLTEFTVPLIPKPHRSGARRARAAPGRRQSECTTACRSLQLRRRSGWFCSACGRDRCGRRPLRHHERRWCKQRRDRLRGEHVRRRTRNLQLPRGDDVLYGTTFSGGASNRGTVFAVSKSESESVFTLSAKAAKLLPFWSIGHF
jgi:hypothetical protein